MRLLLFTVMLFLLLISTPAPSHAVIPVDGGSGDDGAVSDYVQDYRTVRKVGMALAAIGFCIAVSRLATSEAPSERSRAQNLILLTAGVFVFLAGDRMIARSVTEWFGFDPSALPLFWQ